MNANSARPVVAEPGGDQVAAHVGLHAIGSFADRLGLGHSLSTAIPVRGERAPLHDRGKVLVQMALVLAGGGESCLDIEHLRAQEDLFGSVPSDSTVWRAFHELSPATLEGLRGAVATVREKVWARASVTKKGPVVLDLDASLVEIHSDTKATTGPTYKGGFGFHPMFCFADATGECLSALLRPGNAGANTVADHLEVLDAALAQLPADVAGGGHRVGDDPDKVSRQVIARTDSAGATTGFVEGCRARNVKFMVVARTNAQVQGAIFDAVGMDDLWAPALTQNGEVRPGAGVIELTSEVDLSGWPAGTRFIVRREPLHPGAQQTLFRAVDYRYWGHYTDCAGTPVELDAAMRAHAHVEDHIQRLKDSGLCRFPFATAPANRAWLFAVAMAADLVRWFQLLCLDGHLAAARPKALRWSFLHAPGRLVRSGRRLVVRVLDHWPTAPAILGAYQRLATIT